MENSSRDCQSLSSILLRHYDQEPAPKGKASPSLWHRKEPSQIDEVDAAVQIPYGERRGSVFQPLQSQACVLLKFSSRPGTGEAGRGQQQNWVPNDDFDNKASVGSKEDQRSWSTLFT